MIDDEAKRGSKQWGHGYRTGIQAGLQLAEEMTMQQAKLDRIIKQQTNIAQRVLECVPTLDVASRNEILIAYKKAGRSMAQNEFYGVLNGLKKNGLVKEHKTGYFIRVTAAATPLAPKTKSSVSYVEPEAIVITDDKGDDEVIESHPRDPMDIIVEMRDHFEKAMYELCEYYESERLKSDKKMKQLAHFKALMESLNDNE